jgi:ubiquinol-cytochrome c reductase iron-sulfur subunit
MSSIAAAHDDQPTRRDFLTVSAAAFASVGAAAGLWPLADSLNPGSDARAAATIEVDLRPIREGQIISVLWQGKPVFIAHRTPEQIARAEADDKAATLDPARDRNRVKRSEWLVVVGVCTHLGCTPTARGVGQLAPRYGAGCAPAITRNTTSRAAYGADPRPATWPCRPTPSRNPTRW